MRGRIVLQNDGCLKLRANENFFENSLKKMKTIRLKCGIIFVNVIYITVDVTKTPEYNIADPELFRDWKSALLCARSMIND